MIKTIDISQEEVKRLYDVCKKMNKLLRRHRNKLVRGRRLLRLETKYQDRKIKYLLLFRLPALGKDKFHISRRVETLNALISDLEVFATDYEFKIRNAG